MRRVVITGLGAISPIGNSTDEILKSIKESKNGIDVITSFDTSDLNVKLIAEVKNFDPLNYMDKKEVKRNDRFTQFAIAAAKNALENCGTDFKDLDPYRVGVIVGSGIGGLTTIEAEYNKFLEKGTKRVSVFFIPMMITNMAGGSIAIKTGFKGVNYCTVTACATSSHAIGEAYRNIKHGYIDACVTGGTESALTKFAMTGFNNMTALSNSEDKDRGSIPFDKDRSGFVMGEGSGILILEEYEHAKARGAKIYSEIVGYGTTCDAYHMTSPDPLGEGAAKSMQLAIEESGCRLSDIDYINAHGTSTALNDKIETAAIKKVFGEELAKKLAISSTKSMTGHLLGAAGAIEAIVTAIGIENSIAPPTINYLNPDPDCDLDYVVNNLRNMPINYALSNSLGFGGHNATICFKKCS